MASLFRITMILLITSNISCSQEDTTTRSIQDIIQEASSGNYGDIHSLLIFENNELIVEEYFKGYTTDSIHYQFSVTKSIASLLVGIAIDKGFIHSVDDKMQVFFPQHTDLINSSKNKSEITLKHILTMSARFQWDEWTYPYTDSRNDANKIISSNDMIKFMLELPVDDKPGSKFTYNSGCSIMLSGIIESSTGLSVEKFAEKYLFKELGIKRWHWEQGKDGLFNTGWGLHLLPRDMMKIGQLMKNNGRWNNKQIVSSGWVNTSVSNHISNYGFQWWLSKNFYSAKGWGGQVIAIDKNSGLIVVTTAGEFNGAKPAGIRVMEMLIN